MPKPDSRMRDHDAPQFAITRAYTSATKIGGGRSEGPQAPSLRGCCATWTRTAGILGGVRGTLGALPGERAGECPSSGMCQNPLCDGGQIIRNFTGRDGGFGIVKY